jgi:wobble nucleotide-excising tRNase
MINFLQLKNVATYDGTGIELKDLKKINFIYGANGSGKTTLTKYIFDSNHEQFKDCKIGWIQDIIVTPLIYNKDFRDRNFGKGTIDGVFTLGEATKEQIENIEKRKKKRKEVSDDGATKKKTLDGMITAQNERDEDFKKEIWSSIYKKYETDFKEAFRGYLKMDSFKAKLLDEYQNNKGRKLTLEKLKEYAKTILGDRPNTLENITEFLTDEIEVIESDKLWKKKIIGKTDVDIAGLIQSLNMNDWVNQGRNYMQKDETCPFCQEKTLTPAFKKQLDDYFDKAFIADINSVARNAERYTQLTENTINLLTNIESSQKANENSKLNLELFSAYLKTLTSLFQSNRELVGIKLKEPSRVIDLHETNAQLGDILGLIQEANKLITNHNRIVANFDKARNELVQNIWRFILDESDVLISNYIKRRDNLQKGIDQLSLRVEKLREDYKKINKEVIELSKNITSVQPSVDQINATLNSYGFHNFSIVPSVADPNKYQIQREDGQMAEATLSEGEVTFITFLYFLQLAKGSTQENNISDDRILIVDDPISSLDSSILFVISSLIKEIIKDIKDDKSTIKQLILLTHNVYFHKEVSFINGRTKECNQTKYWILRRYNKSTSSQCFEMENPIQNSYELLWKELKNREHCSGLTIQNTMRRIIENYFKILGKYGDDDLINKFESPEDREICRSLLYWINDGSHTIPDDLYIERQDDVVQKYFDVFKNVFIHTKHIEHYKMMMGEA